MRKPILLATLIGCLTVANNLHAATIHFSSDFDNAIDTGATISDGGYSLQTVFGDPDLSSGALHFNTGGSGTYEQTSLDLSGAGLNKSFHIEFDLLTQNLANSQWGFRTLFDTPIVQTLNFNNCCSNSINTHTPYASPMHGSLGSLIDNQWMHIAIDIDLPASMWSIDILGVGTSTGGFYSQSGGINSMRFSLSPASGSVTGPNPSIHAYVDNLLVTSVPAPAPIWLMLTGLISLIGLSKKARAKWTD